jgi:hypothetical protein
LPAILSRSYSAHINQNFEKGAQVLSKLQTGNSADMWELQIFRKVQEKHCMTIINKGYKGVA